MNISNYFGMMTDNRKPAVLAVCGPTASGKTALSVALAERLNGEILSCDSMQIYRGMDIGTAKPTEEEKKGIPHHLIDICSPEDDFSCADYARLAKEKIAEVLSRGKLPIFCGGTGLYLDAALSGERFAPDIPKEAEERAALLSPEDAYEALRAGDPASAEAIHPNNIRRVRRALAVLYGTGKPKSEWDRLSKSVPSPYRATVIGLNYTDREVLYGRIEKRVEMMLESGLEEEARRLNLRRDCTAAQAIGYKELYGWIDGKMSREEAAALLCQSTRNYAKRQLTWFRHRENIKWLFPDRYEEPAIAGLTEDAVRIFLADSSL